MSLTVHSVAKLLAVCGRHLVPRSWRGRLFLVFAFLLVFGEEGLFGCWGTRAGLVRRGTGGGRGVAVGFARAHSLVVGGVGGRLGAVGSEVLGGCVG